MNNNNNNNVVVVVVYLNKYIIVLLIQYSHIHQLKLTYIISILTNNSEIFPTCALVLHMCFM